MSFFLHGTNHYEDLRTINFPFFGGNSQLFKNRHLTRLRFWSFGHARSFSSLFQLAVDPIWRRLYHWVRLGTAGIRDAAAIFSTQSIPVIGQTGKRKQIFTLFFCSRLRYNFFLLLTILSFFGIYS